MYFSEFFHFSRGVSSFNHFIHELSVDSDVSSLEYSSAEDSDDGYEEYPESPSSQSSRASRANWILVPIHLLLGIPFRLFQLAYSGSGVSKPPLAISANQHPSQSHFPNKVQSLKDQIIHRTTDRRRGIIEVVQLFLSLLFSVVFCFLDHLFIQPF